MSVRIYRIESSALAEVKGVLEEPEGEKEVEGETKWVKNEFARNGYSLRDARSMGFEEPCSYLYIKAEDEFFEQNEKAIMKEGVKRLEGEDYERVQAKIEGEQAGAAEGVGAVFGDF